MRCNRHCLALYVVDFDHARVTPLEAALASKSHSVIEVGYGY
jgi:hypothetical protein